MSKARTLIIAIVLLVVLAAAAVAAYVIIQNNRAPEALVPTSPAASESAGAGGDTESAIEFDPQSLTGTWDVASDSIAGYRVDEVLGGQDVTVVGRTDKVDGTVTVTDSAITDAQIVVNVDSVETDSSNRDAEFRKLLGTDQNPDAVFTAQGPIDLVANQTTYEVPGTLSVAGATNTVVATIDVTVSANGTQLVGNFPIVFEDFGISAPNLGFVTVEDQGIVEFSLNMTPN